MRIVLVIFAACLACIGVVVWLLARNPSWLSSGDIDVRGRGERK